MIIYEDLYQSIKQVMPIPCVDLMITNPDRQLLLVKRKNEPARNMWWFPGGRVHFAETRHEAARRKLYEECGLVASSIREMGTYDVILEAPEQPLSHGITTVFHLTVVQVEHLQLDYQSQQACWLSLQEWLREELHPFIQQTLQTIELP